MAPVDQNSGESDRVRIFHSYTALDFHRNLNAATTSLVLRPAPAIRFDRVGI